MMISNKKKALIHIAKQELGMNDKEYRDLLGGVGVSSSRELTDRTFDQAMAHMRQLGFKPKRRPGPPLDPARGRPGKKISPDKPFDKAQGELPSKKRLLGKVEAVLADLGLTWGYADAVARNMFKIDSVKWCNEKQLHSIVAALSYHQKRKKGYVGK